MGERESGLGDAPCGREPRRPGLSQELPRESGLGIYESLVSIKKGRRPQVLWRGSWSRAKTQGEKKAGVLERHRPVPSEASVRPQLSDTLSQAGAWNLSRTWDKGHAEERESALSPRRSLGFLKSGSEGLMC